VVISKDADTHRILIPLLKHLKEALPNAKRWHYSSKPESLRPVIQPKRRNQQLLQTTINDHQPMPATNPPLAADDQ